MVTESLRSEVIAIAERQAGLTDDDLQELLLYEWERAGLALADRGPGDYLRTVRDELLSQAISQRDTVGVMTAMIANDALNWAAQHGYASNEYAFVIGVLVAWVTRAALHERSTSGNIHDGDDESCG